MLAQLARARMRAKITALQEAFIGYFTDHHAFLLGKMLARVDALDADIAELDATIEEIIAPFGDALTRLDEIPGIGPRAAAVIIAEIGLDMGVFPTPGQLVSWAKLSPRTLQSGATRRAGTTGKGNPYLKAALGEPPPPPPRPTPSSASATAAWSGASASSRPWSPSPAPSW